jgi:uncharacterized protein YdaU (DUF1376 family)
MNYYEHHIRDYDAATAHLTWDQDLAYTRLIRWYYRKEQPLPADVKEVCRLVRATTKSQKTAVTNVLTEFFILQTDGWHHEVCDAAIEKFLAGEPERAVKKANENNRLARHREERARLFKALTDKGGSAPWNIKIDELRTLVERVSGASPASPETDLDDFGNAHETHPATAHETPATATHPPDTIHQTPSTNKKKVNLKPSEANASGETPAGTQIDLVDYEPAGMTAQESVWSLGVPMLVAAGQAERNARSLLGKWCKAYGAPAVQAAIVRCAQEQPVEPVSWLIAALGTPLPKGADVAQQVAPSPGGGEWWVRAGFAKEYEAVNAGATEKYAHLWRDGRPLVKVYGANVEPWPEGTYERT